MAQRVFVTGGSGFVGSAVIEELLSHGYEVHALLRHGTLGDLENRVKTFHGDLFDASVLDAGMAGCDAVIHLVGIIAEKPAKGVTFERIHVEGTRAVVEATKRAKVGRYVQMSALGTRPKAESEYHQTKYRAEEIVRTSALEWTIIRPSMIHGPRGEFMKLEAAWAKKSSMPFLFMPYFGAGVLGTGGAGKLQPAYVDDVARAFVDALDNPKTVANTYAIAGSEVLSWPELHRAVAEAVVGHRRWVMPIPAWYAKTVARVVPASLLPFNRDQVIMSQEDNTADMTPFTTDFGWTPGPFRQLLETYAGELRGKK
jgi:uncharacterized protein YbjT (DUF2867 family)